MSERTLFGHEKGGTQITDIGNSHWNAVIIQRG